MDVSHTLISQVTEAVVEDVREWQARHLDSIYPKVSLDCIVVKIHQEKRVTKKSIYLVALGINTDGMKELFGLVDQRERRIEVLDVDTHRNTVARGAGYLHSLCGWSCRIPSDKNTVVYGPHGKELAEV